MPPKRPLKFLPDDPTTIAERAGAPYESPELSQGSSFDADLGFLGVKHRPAEESTRNASARRPPTGWTCCTPLDEVSPTLR